MLALAHAAMNFEWSCSSLVLYLLLVSNPTQWVLFVLLLASPESAFIRVEPLLQRGGGWSLHCCSQLNVRMMGMIFDLNEKHYL